MSIKSRIGWTALAVVAVAGIGLTTMATAGFGFAAPAEQVKPKVATAKVVKKDLIDTADFNATVGYDAQQKLALAGGTVTWLPKEGDVIQRGGALYKADEQPRVLLYGALPLWRPLSIGTKGDDVRQFEQNLADLGYNGFDVDNLYTANTAAAVKKWQKSLGLDQTGTVEQRWVYYATGPVRVTALIASIGTDAGEVLQVANDSRVISVTLKPVAAKYAVVGAKVSYVSADGATGTGSVVSVKSVVATAAAAGSTAEGGSTELQVTIQPDDAGALGKLGDSTAKVSFTIDTRPGVLTVPVTALLALAEGGYAVQVVDPAAPNGSRLLGVKTGLFSQGLVEVSGDGLADGQEVLVAS